MTTHRGFARHSASKFVFLIPLVMLNAGLTDAQTVVESQSASAVENSESKPEERFATPESNQVILKKAQSTVSLVDQKPVAIERLSSDVLLVDFGRVAFGNIRLVSSEARTVVVHFGEKMADGRVDREPPGSVRYNHAAAQLTAGQSVVVAPPADARNTEVNSTRHPPAILTPNEWGVVLPFRWVEIEGWKGEFTEDHIVRQAAFSNVWDDDAASFKSSDDTLNRIWELCRYSIKATTFAGIYIDGDRERIPYEADAHLNQLSHYATDNDLEMARNTFDWLIHNGTWPTECTLQMTLIAHADWMHTGDLAWLLPRYEILKSKLHSDRLGEDGLIHSLGSQRGKDLVDWPSGERDGFVFSEINTVVNAFRLTALQRLAQLADAVGKPHEAKEYRQQFERSKHEFQRLCFDATTGLYRDGAGVDHSSLHANMFPLAFGLVPAMHQKKLIEWIEERGMRCSVFAAQFLLDGLFRHDADELALQLMTADGDRNWRHMLESGTTITWEAWDRPYKSNLDWNHPWGTAPANLLPRYVLGVEAIEPGWQRTRIRPMPGGLSHAEGKVPTPRGPISVQWENTDHFSVRITIPDGMVTEIDIPASASSQQVFVDGRKVAAQRVRERWVLSSPINSSCTIEAR